MASTSQTYTVDCLAQLIEIHSSDDESSEKDLTTPAKKRRKLSASDVTEEAIAANVKPLSQDWSIADRDFPNVYEIFVSEKSAADYSAEPEEVILCAPVSTPGDFIDLIDLPPNYKGKSPILRSIKAAPPEIDLGYVLARLLDAYPDVELKVIETFIEGFSKSEDLTQDGLIEGISELIVQNFLPDVEKQKSQEKLAQQALDNLWAAVQYVCSQVSDADPNMVFARLENNVADLATEREKLLVELLATPKDVSPAQISTPTVVAFVPCTSTSSALSSLSAGESSSNANSLIDMVMAISTLFPKVNSDMLFARLEGAQDAEKEKEMILRELADPKLVGGPLPLGNYTLEGLQPGTENYESIVDLIRQSVANPAVRIVAISKICNDLLLQQFMMRRNAIQSDIELERGVQQTDVPIEKLLFHGTSHDSVHSICLEGLDRGFGGKNGTMYGNGCYFATQFSYSQKFATARPGDGHQFMLVCRVLTGYYTVGNPSLRVLPLRPGSDRRFHCAVDNANHPQIYVTFHDNSAYPAYLVAFTTIVHQQSQPSQPPPMAAPFVPSPFRPSPAWPTHSSPSKTWSSGLSSGQMIPKWSSNTNSTHGQIQQQQAPQHTIFHAQGQSPTFTLQQQLLAPNQISPGQPPSQSVQQSAPPVKQVRRRQTSQRRLSSETQAIRQYSAQLAQTRLVIQGSSIVAPQNVLLPPPPSSRGSSTNQTH